MFVENVSPNFVFGVVKSNVGNHLKRVFPKFEAERSHPRGVNGRSKFRKKIEIRENVRRFKVDKVPSWNKGRPSIYVITVLSAISWEWSGRLREVRLSLSRISSDPSPLQNV